MFAMPYCFNRYSRTWLTQNFKLELIDTSTFNFNFEMTKPHEIMKPNRVEFLHVKTGAIASHPIFLLHQRTFIRYRICTTIIYFDVIRCGALRLRPIFG